MATDTTTERTFDISIECNNAAFDGALTGPELARILRSLADDLEQDEIVRGYSARLRDINGNHCGAAEMFHADYRR